MAVFGLIEYKDASPEVRVVEVERGRHAATSGVGQRVDDPSAGSVGTAG